MGEGEAERGPLANLGFRPCEKAVIRAGGCITLSEGKWKGKCEFITRSKETVASLRTFYPVLEVPALLSPASLTQHPWVSGLPLHFRLILACENCKIATGRICNPLRFCFQARSSALGSNNCFNPFFKVGLAFGDNLTHLFPFAQKDPHRGPLSLHSASSG